MEPVRTCLGCRQRCPQASLLRCVARDGHIVPDPSGTLTGRGAWVHPTAECVDNTIKRRAFERALRAAGALDEQQLRQHLHDHQRGVRPDAHNEQAD